MSELYSWEERHLCNKAGPNLEAMASEGLQTGMSPRDVIASLRAALEEVEARVWEMAKIQAQAEERRYKHPKVNVCKEGS